MDTRIKPLEAPWSESVLSAFNLVMPVRFSESVLPPNFPNKKILFIRGPIMPNHNFKSIPSLPVLYLKAGMKRNTGKLTELPHLSLTVTDFRLDPKQLRRYLDYFEFDDLELIPAPFLYLATQSIQLYLLSLPKFPISPAGLVHLGVKFEHKAEIKSDSNLSVEMAVSNQRASKKGLVFELKTCVFIQEGMPAMIMTNTYLARAVKHNAETGLPVLCDNSVKQSANIEQSLTSIDLDKDAGKRYAKLSGDYNPIHLFSWSARLFGFRRPIIHGFYLISRVWSAYCKQTEKIPNEGVFQFKSPLYLPGRAELILQHSEHQYAVLVRSMDKHHLYGRFK